MRTGRLRHRVKVLKNYATRDAYGNKTDEWRTETTRWAAVEPISGRESIVAEQVQSEVTHRVLLRRPLTIDATYRIQFGDRFLDIVNVIDRDERGISVELLCKEIA